MRTYVLTVPLSLLLAAAVGCAATAADQELDELELVTSPTELARVATADGALWRFLEAEPGELFMWAILANGADNIPNDVELDRMSYVDLYRRLTSAPVPRTLLEAQARADALVDEEPTPDEGGLVNEAGGGAKEGGLTAQISASDFQSDYCWFNFDYAYCWPSFYGSPYVQRKTYSGYGHVAAVNNTITFRFRYKKHWYSSWTTLVSAQALPGQVHYVHQSYFGYRRWRRWEVLDNGANLVRYSLSGSE